MAVALLCVSCVFFLDSNWKRLVEHVFSCPHQENDNARLTPSLMAVRKLRQIQQLSRASMNHIS